MRRRLLLIVLMAVVATSCNTSSGRRTQPEPADQISRGLSEAAQEDPPAYFLGETFHGLSISGVQNGMRTTVFYGTCTIYGEGGCAPPFQVQTEPFTGTSWSNAVGCSRLADIRSVPAVHFGGARC